MRLIRHGESEANIRWLWGGDAPLTDKGRRQAEELPKTETSLVVASGLLRAKQTARIVYPDHELMVDNTIDEIHMGRFENHSMMDDEEMWRLYFSEPYLMHLYSGGDDVQRRAEMALERLNGYPTDTVIFTHNTLMRAMMSVMEYGSVKYMNDIKVPNCGIWEV